MSTLKTIYLQHLNGANTNATLDANGNMTVTGTVCGASSNMFRNRIINGDMRIDQRNAGASVTVLNAWIYTVDRWAGYGSQSSKFTVQQNAGSVTPPAGFTNYLGVTSSSSYSVVAADEFLIRQSVEGFNVADLGWGTASAKTVTLSFWVRSSLTGSFGGCLYAYGQTRSYPFSYTISSANTWTYITVTVPGDTTGTWKTDNSAGIVLLFGMGVGSTYGSGTAGAWTSSVIDVPAGSVSIVGTSGATWYVTGVQLEAGTTATPFEIRNYGHELALCQRYFEKSFEQAVVPTNGSGVFTTYTGASMGIATNRSVAGTTITFQVTKRATPTFTAYGSTSGAWGYIAPNGTSVSFSTNVGYTYLSQSNFNFNQQVVDGAFVLCIGHWTASAEL